MLGADTIVTLDGAVIGKPADEQDAHAMLARLQGQTHEVLGGVALARDGDIAAEGVARTAVRFRDGIDVAAYVATGEWRGRAGGYAIQERGALLVAEIEGDYLNVVGLPVALLADLAPDLFALR